jgi:hypothetical protein
MRVLADDDTPWPDARWYVRTFDYPVETAPPDVALCVYRVVTQIELSGEEASGFIVSSSCVTTFSPTERPLTSTPNGRRDTPRRR